LDTPLNRTWKSLVGNSKKFLDGKGTFFNSLSSIIYSGNIASQHHETFALVYVILKDMLTSGKGRYAPLLQGKEKINESNYFIDSRDRWDFSKQQIINYINDFDVSKFRNEIDFNLGIIRLNY
jgi:hypothetical protein